MTETVQIEYDKLKYMTEEELVKIKDRWLFRLYENKWEADKLYLDFTECELEALIRVIVERRGY